MDVDIAIEVQIELLENWSQSFDVIVGRFTRISRQREVALKQNLLLGNVSDHQPVGVRNWSDVVQLAGTRSIQVDLLLRTSFALGFLGIFRERVVQQRSWSVERF